MRVTQTYPMPPYQCARCLTGRTPGIDLLVDDDENPNDNRAIYLCWACVKEAAEKLGDGCGWKLLTVTDIAEIQAQMEQHLDQSIEATAAAQAAVLARDALLKSLELSPLPKKKVAAAKAAAAEVTA